MIKTIAISALAAAATLSAVAASAQISGNWVLAPWRDGPHLFPGVVTANAGGQVTVRFDDGTTATMASTRVEPFTWQTGTRVECRWRNGERWYGGRIETISSNGSNLAVLYEDGDRENTTTGRCRTPAR